MRFPGLPLLAALVAVPAAAVQVPFTATFQVGAGSNTPPPMPYWTSAGWPLPQLSTTVTGMAEVSYVGTTPVSTQFPAVAFSLSDSQTGQDFFYDENGFPQWVGSAYVSGTVQTQAMGGSVTPGVVNAPGLVSGTFYLDSYNAMTGAGGHFEPPLALIGGNGTYSDIVGSLDGSGSYPMYYSWQAAPWTITTSPTQVSISSWGAVDCITPNAIGFCPEEWFPGAPFATFGAAATFKLAPGTGQTGFGPGTGTASLLGGAGKKGGVNILLDVDAGEGLLTAVFQAATLGTIQGTYGLLPYGLPGGAAAPTSLWTISGGEQFQGTAQLTFAYDAALLPPGYDETLLAIAHFDGSLWELLTGTVDVNSNTITVVTDSFSPFALVAVPEPGTGLLVAAGVLALTARRRSRPS